jgi:hypothetical protein
VASVYDVPRGELRHRDEGAAWQSAWNADGSILAVGTWTGWNFNLWDASTWTHQAHLALPLAWSERPGVGGFIVPAGLCFDQTGNLYVAEPSSGYEPPNAYSPGVHIWSKREVASYHTESIGTACSRAVIDMSASSRTPETRVVLANADAGCTLEVLAVQTRGGKPTVRRAYKLDRGQAHGLERPHVSVTADGKYLFARDSQQYCLFELFDDHASLAYAHLDKFDTTMPGAGVKGLDVSLDGRAAAFGSEHSIRVVRISDGASLLEVQQEPGAFALSPDSRLLAVPNQGRKSICFYRINQ